MGGMRTSLCLFLLLNQLLFCPTDAGQNLSTMQMNTYKIKDQGGTSPSAMEPSRSPTDHADPQNTDTNGTCSQCLINTEIGLIAIGSAGGLIVCLVVATVLLACQVCHIRRWVHAPQTSRSNMDLVGTVSYWGTDQQDVRGVIGPCDTSVILEEVTQERKMEEERQAKTERAKEGAMAVASHPEEKVSQMLGYSSKDFCLEVPRDIEDMPLVV